MTSKQKYIVAALAVANAVIILGLTALMMHLARMTALPLPTPVSRTAAATSGSPVHPAGEMCQWQAAQQMAQAGLSGSVTLSPGGALYFEIATALAPGQTADDAAQSVWTAFDVALALDGACAFTQVEITIRVQDTATMLHASVSAADLAAYGSGALTEDEFSDRVTYTISSR